MLDQLSRRRFLACVSAGPFLVGNALRTLAADTPASRKAPDRLDRTHLLLYHDANGRVQPVESPADWMNRRAAIVRGMEKVMGPLPGGGKNVPLDLKIEEETDCGSYLRRFVRYSAEPGSRTPAYLLIPKRVLNGDRNARAILCLHPTDHNIGHKVVVGLGGKPNRQYAAELAERGFVTLAPSYPLLAEYQPDIKKLGYQSGTMKAVWDNVRGLDLLEELPFVQDDSFGVIGHSLGGHNAIFTAVFDRRLRVIASSCGFDSFLDYYDGDPNRWKPGEGWCQLRYMPRLADYAGRLETIPFDFHELIGALAPRICFVNAPLHDSNFKWESVDKIAAAARPVYRLYGKPENLIVKHPDSGHDFPDPLREQAYRILQEQLG